MVSKLEKSMVLDFLGQKHEELHGKPIKVRYDLFVKAKSKSNSFVLCLNCMNIRNRYKDEQKCSAEPEYDLNTTYTKILELI